MDMYVSKDGALVGAARVARETLDREREKVSSAAVRRLRMRQDRRRKAFSAQLMSDRAGLMADLEDLEGMLPSEPSDERAARLAELKYRKRI